MKLKSLKNKPFPKPVSLASLLGPSFILLGLGLGSGELILWPYLASKFGLGIMWGALLGITFQFFINTEIERYALATGESVFVGLARKLKTVAPLWFIFSTFVPWIWPGIIASSGTVIAHIFGIPYTPLISIILLLFIGFAITLGPVIYKTQEVFQRTLITVGVPFILIVTLILAKPGDWSDLAVGLLGQGDGYLFLPMGISIGTFLGAFAYAGAGGNLNLAQSFYIKEKGYGMGKYSGRITSILTGKKEKISLEGHSFEPSAANLKKFRAWWRRITTEHLIVFWLTGALTMIFLSLLAYTTVFGKADHEGIDFLFTQGAVIGERLFPLAGTVFLIIAGLMLFSTQFSIFDATSRIMSENLVILSQKLFRIEKLPIFYYIFLWAQIAAGVAIFAFGSAQPITLVILGAILNAIAMFVYSGLVLWMNLTSLHKAIRPRWPRILVISGAFAFYGIFSIITLLQQFT